MASASWFAAPRLLIYLRDANDWEPVSRVHGRYFADVRPANTLIAVAGLVGDYDVEIEAEAELGGVTQSEL